MSTFKINESSIDYRHNNSDNSVILSFGEHSKGYFTNRLRRQYRTLRKAGLDKYAARSIIWDVAWATVCGNGKFVSYKDNEK